MINLQITTEHIAKSEPMLEEKNPLGFALKEYFPNSKIHIGIKQAQVDNCILKLSPKLIAYLEDFDIDGKAEPINLEMDISIK